MNMFKYIMKRLSGGFNKPVDVPIFKRETIRITATEPMFTTLEKFEPNKVISAKGAPFQFEITKADIQQRAYELWKNSGCPNGKDVDFWCQAERELKTQNK
jgi:hypothetical protein